MHACVHACVCVCECMLTCQHEFLFLMYSLVNMSSCFSGIHTHTVTFSISTQDGVSAFDIAKQQNHLQLCEILEKHGAKQTGPGSQVVM